MSGRGTLLPFRRSSPAKETPIPDVAQELELGDEALLMACVVGDEAALGALYDRHNRPVFRFVSRISAGPGSDVEDLVQCTFIEVWKSAGRFHGKGTVRSWIFGISANLARHYVRAEVRRRTAMDNFSEFPLCTKQGLVLRPDDSMNQNQLMRELSQAMHELSYEQRIAFVLCDIEGMSGVDAARTLGVRKGTLWRRLHDARKTLRSKLQAGDKPWT
ncbi:MAG: RNA polymerase sigma factor [Kofleriaceae bacterium]|nr:RNA polymerase sigma factor [Kofleriaceae bacterium]